MVYTKKTVKNDIYIIIDPKIKICGHSFVRLQQVVVR